MAGKVRSYVQCSSGEQSNILAVQCKSTAYFLLLLFCFVYRTDETESTFPTAKQNAICSKNFRFAQFNSQVFLVHSFYLRLQIIANSKKKKRKLCSHREMRI